MTEGQPQVARVEPGEVTPTLVTTLYTGALVSRVEAGVVALTGPGAVTSFQGLLTNDVELPGDGSFVYGALLTPKGMIVVDGWAARLGATVSYTVPAHGGGRERALAIFTRSVPPRLARVSDRTSEVAVYRLAGPGALAVAVAAGLEVPPAAGRVLPRPDGVETARATEGAPFVLQVTVPAEAAALLAARLEAAGAVAAGPATLELSRILAGWPRLGAEVDDRTIPQEARLDQIGGVSYTKGCYTGQETVARLHFRGHVNRQIRGLLFDPEPPAAPADGWSVVTYVDRDVGRVTSLAFVPETGVAGAGRWIGLALIRREVEPGSVVRAAGRDARVVDSPSPSRSPRPHERARHGREWPRRQSRGRGPRRARRAGARAGTAGESRRRAAARGRGGHGRRHRPGGVAGCGARRPRHRALRRDRAAPGFVGSVRRGQRRRDPTRGGRRPNGGRAADPHFVRGGVRRLSSLSRDTRAAG